MTFTVPQNFTDEIERLLAPRQISPPGKTGWRRVRCPSCGDVEPAKTTGSFLRTESNGWRFLCFSHYCLLARPAIGWEPGWALSERVQYFYQLLTQMED